MELIGNVKNYDWGKLGADSMVAQLAASNSTNFKIDPVTPYSELWMGAHPSGPSTVKATGVPLDKALPASEPALPFLFKVLSIRKALSIQVHPNKDEAERLHRERPDVYKDANHKPELAIALSPFRALCGFRPYEEVYRFCQELPPLKTLLGGDTYVERLRGGTGAASGLRICYEKLMGSDTRAVIACIGDIAKNYAQVLCKSNLMEVFLKINTDFPNDVGVLSIFFVNLLTLQPGQAIFLGANEIHAYLSGDCIECMACSDNVIRAGLTPKYKDVAQLIACLNYTGAPAASRLFQPHRIDAHVQMFVPPVKDFAVTQLHLSSDTGDYSLQVQPYGSILLALSGARRLRLNNQSEVLLQRGSIIYIPPSAAPEIEFLCVDKQVCQTTAAAEEDFVAYMATYNSFKSDPAA